MKRGRTEEIQRLRSMRPMRKPSGHFIQERISFLSIFDVTEEVLNHWKREEIHSIEDIHAADARARFMAEEAIKKAEL